MGGNSDLSCILYIISDCISMLQNMQLTNLNIFPVMHVIFQKSASFLFLFPCLFSRAWRYNYNRATEMDCVAFHQWFAF